MCQFCLEGNDYGFKTSYKIKIIKPNRVTVKRERHKEKKKERKK